MHRWKEWFPSLPLVLAMVLALGTLATLQYRWVGDISRAEQERMAANLDIGARHIAEEFNRELARAYLALQMDAATLRDRAWDRYEQRYDRWRTTAPHPEMVREILLVEGSPTGRITLSRYNHDQRHFAPQSWPTELIGLKRKIELAYRASLTANTSTATRELSPVAADIPALLVPLSRVWLLSDQQDLDIDADLIFSETVLPGTQRICPTCRPVGSGQTLFAHMVVLLDREYLTSTLLPELAQRYLQSDGTQPYYLVVAPSDEPERILYTSDPNPQPTNRETDISVPLFTVQFDDLSRLMLTNRIQSEEDGAVRSDRVAIGILGQDGISSVGKWQLSLRHREGSLETAITTTRTRNLFVNGSILLVLAISMVMLLISTRRAQYLARQQLEFAAAISHELRTPLAVICSAGENLADGVVHDAQRTRQYGTLIHQEGRRLTEMVEHALAFASQQSGRNAYHMRPLDVELIIEQAIAPFRSQLSSIGYTIDRAIAPDVDPIVADEAALLRSLQNLISNAIKYGGEQRWIGVQAKTAHYARGSEVQISVQDRGPGIPPDELEHIFEPFYRGRTAAAIAHGSGLGLSIVNEAIRAHGGRISVESDPQQGTTFTLHLPAQTRYAT